MPGKAKPQAFNDGIVSIYALKNTALPGMRPQSRLEPVSPPLRYEERTVGSRRYYDAKAVQVRVDRVLRVQRRPGVLTDQIAVTADGQQYTVRQVQFPVDVSPQCADLSLERIKEEDRYDLD